MFLCDPCHGPELCHGSVVRSSGQCEACGQIAACLDCHTPAHREKIKKVEGCCVGQGEGTQACCNDLVDHPPGPCPNCEGSN